MDKTEEITLRKVKRYLVQHLSKEFVIDFGYEPFIGHYIVKVIQEQLAKKAGERVIKYPKNWKEAFKERWFPGWFRKRFPIKYKVYDALVMFPDFLKEHPVPRGFRDNNYYFTYAEEGAILPKEDKE